MKQFYQSRLKNIVLFLLLGLSAGSAAAHSCSTAQGDQTSYGTNNVWIGYVYEGKSFNYYHGFVTEGSASNPNFNESFGGNQVYYNTNGCSVYTDTFSVRYKLTASYSGNFTITVGGDDGVRFSLDGGNTWVINH